MRREVELNLLEDNASFLVRLNNFTGRHPLVGLLKGWHELRWPPNNSSHSGF